ncbi:IucA/IucC family protein [Jeotgalibacillus sp. ET6]|uniref:IucA/IucC family protein n=1 Tax=Jeotgalibacillus sp. ET6 TaxID=3037260 RepID=UPI0024182DCD|nr:IucA/IucC family protein [Jeotgalibacillus sp. ET6]MDG5472156.1 IucA/IucC family protein [Jeotgalibacillus sp. ET6]
MKRCKTDLRVCRQLIEALLFENLLSCTEKEAGGGILHFHIPLKDAVLHCSGKRGAFGRIRIEGDSMRLEKGTNSEAITLDTLLNSADFPSSFSLELKQTKKLTQWNEQHLTQPEKRSSLSYEELESAIWEGHPYHPCFKSRTGFSLEDHEHYGPEAGNQFALVWLACPKKEVRRSFSNEELFWKKEIGQVYDELMERLVKKGGQRSQYSLIPVHPWQWKAVCDKVKGAIFLGEAAESYRATQSIRTLWNTERSEKAHIKLPMNLTHTSSIRTIAPPAAAAAPAISEWLSSIVKADPLLSITTVLEEYASACWEPAECDVHPGEIGVIFRESPRSVLAAGEEAVPLNACSLTEGNGKLFIENWLKQYGVEKWLKQLIQIVIIPIWHFLVRHGIALEAHAQNVVLIVKDGWPAGMAVRDFHDSIEYVESFLTEPEKAPRFWAIHPDFKKGKPDEFYWMSSVEGLRELVIDTLFVFHFTELSNALEQKGILGESLFWSWVEDALAEYEQEHPELESRIKEIDYRKKWIQAEALLSQKIAPSKPIYHTVVNVFADER